MIIAAIVYVDQDEPNFEKDEAMSCAREIFKSLVEYTNFDYFVTFDEDCSVAGASRWGPHPTVAKWPEEDAIQLIDKLWKAKIEEDKDYLQRMRSVLALYSDDEIIAGRPETNILIYSEPRIIPYDQRTESQRNLDMFRFYSYYVGMYTGPGVNLYDKDGEGIRDPDHLHNALHKWPCLYEREGKRNPHAEQEVYIVPADVHY